jgi:hypothetical protein
MDSDTRKPTIMPAAISMTLGSKPKPTTGLPPEPRCRSPGPAPAMDVEQVRPHPREEAPGRELILGRVQDTHDRSVASQHQQFAFFSASPPWL